MKQKENPFRRLSFPSPVNFPRGAEQVVELGEKGGVPPKQGLCREYLACPLAPLHPIPALGFTLGFDSAAAPGRVGAEGGAGSNDWEGFRRNWGCLEESTPTPPLPPHKHSLIAKVYTQHTCACSATNISHWERSTSPLSCVLLSGCRNLDLGYGMFSVLVPHTH